MPKIKAAAISPAVKQTAEAISSTYGNMLTIKNVESYLGVSRHTAEKWLSDVDAIVICRTKKYPAIDIARKIEANRVPGGSAL